MGQVAVTLNGRSYQIACDDGQEERLIALAASVDERIAELVEAVGQIGDLRLLVMVSLLLADDVMDLQEQLDAGAEMTLPSDADSGEPTLAPPLQAGSSNDLDARAEALERLAARIESVASQLEGP